MFPNGSGTGPSIGPYTSMMNVLGPKPMTFIVDDALEQKYQDMITGPTEAARKYGFARFQQAVHEQAAWIKFGDYIRIIGTRAEVKGFEPHRIPRVWNVWLQR
jgi:peptide/nickel transport system substrate-binding protein